MASFAPLETASNANAPVPANKSSTVASFKLKSQSANSLL